MDPSKEHSTGTISAFGGRDAVASPADPEADVEPDDRSGGLWHRALAVVQPVVDLLNAQIGHNVRLFMSDRRPLVWLIALFLGVGVAYLAVAFRLSIGMFQYLWLGTTSEKVATAAMAMPWWVVLCAPAAGGALVGYILYRFMPGHRAHGVADVIEARAIRDCEISPAAGGWSVLLASISLGFGASAGREGPIVHLGATVASFIENYFQFTSGTRRILLACGVAAAVSASFNAPMAGVLFAHEVILAHYALSAFVPIVIASVAATLVARVHLGDYPAFFIPDYQITTYWEFPAFALLGVTCAAVAIAFETALMVTEKVSWKFEAPIWARPIVGGFMVGGIALMFPQVLGVGYEATDAALNLQYPLWMMLALFGRQDRSDGDYAGDPVRRRYLFADDISRRHGRRLVRPDRQRGLPRHGLEPWSLCHPRHGCGRGCRARRTDFEHADHSRGDQGLRHHPGPAADRLHCPRSDPGRAWP